MSDMSMLDDDDIDPEKLFRAGSIAISKPEQRRILEEAGKADNPRIRFIGDAAEVGGDE